MRRKILHAIAFLHDTIQKSIENGTNRLPPTKSLAERADVSIVTMNKAINILKNKYLLSASPRKGIYISCALQDGYEDSKVPFLKATKEKLNVNEERKYKWQMIREDILERITNGSFAPETVLPTAKELSYSYGTCHANISKALKVLSNENKIVRFKRGFKVPNIPALDANGTIVLITHWDDISAMSSISSFFIDFYGSIERLQNKHNYKLKLVSQFDVTDGDIANRTSFEQIEHSNTVIGYIIITIALPEEKTKQLLRILCTRDKPVALFDDRGFIRNNPSFLQFPNLRTFRIDNESTNPGISIGNYLFSKGHRKVAYFSFSSHSQWSQNRISGISKSMATRSVPAPVKQFKVENDWNSFIQTSEFTSLANRFRFNPANSLYFRSRYIQPFLRDYFYNYAMRPVLKKALEDSSITAWVGENDKVALMAYFFLIEHSIEVPGRIAVVGFDNSSDAISYGITSYHFNAPAVVENILHFFFTPKYMRLRENRTHIDISGIIMVRRSSDDMMMK